MTLPDRQLPAWVAPSSPRHNDPLVPRVERLARELRLVAARLEASVELPFTDLYGPRRTGLGFTLSGADVARRSAWALIGEWLVAASVGAECAVAGLRAAHEWFWERSGLSLGTVPDVSLAINVTDPVELRALMPYLLDPMAAGTRRDVLKAQSTLDERRTRKATGVFYTPGDVAHLMVERVSSAHGQTDRPLWLDPAHGSGVFLRAVLSAIHMEPGVYDRIYGVDLEPLAAETSSFVLTAEDISLRPDGLAPWERWHKFRRNLATGDALMILASKSDVQPTLELEFGEQVSDGAPLGGLEPWRLESVFPETAEKGFARIVANPPYAPLNSNSGSFHLPKIHPVTGSSARSDISPVFVELCTNLLAEDGALAIVLPLSIVASTRAPFPGLRHHLADQLGRIDLLSFDRMPDALFGDDIKTRNSIIYLDKAAPSSLAASPLYRWTSKIREAALPTIPTASIDGLKGVPQLIPKIGTEWERELFIACGSQERHLDQLPFRRSQASLAKVGAVIQEERADLLALAPTAYNFLGVVREPHRAITEGHNSDNRYSILHFASDLEASAAYAVLNSRLAFWLWHVTGDGFHVTGSLHGRVPVPSADDKRMERLAELGDQLWKAVIERPQISTNRGRTAVTYPTWMQLDTVEEIDADMGALVGIDYAGRLSTWYEQLVVVDRESERRNLIRRKTQ